MKRIMKRIIGLDRVVGVLVAAAIVLGIGVLAHAQNLTVVGKTKTQKIELGDKWILSGVGDAQVPAGDEWLRMLGPAGTYYGGLAAGQLWTQRFIMAQGRTYARGGIDAGNEDGTDPLHVSGGEGNWGVGTFRGVAPTIRLRDTDHLSAMIHVNSNFFYVLRGCAIDGTSWCAVNNAWPLQINLEDNFAWFGGGANFNGKVHALDAHIYGSAHIVGYIRGATMGFGGMYQMSNTTCVSANPFTGGCSCPAGFADQAFAANASTTSYISQVTHSCYK